MDPLIFQLVQPFMPSRGFYLDVGAHDGRSSSNTFHLEKLGWHGILIEPVIMKYFKMIKIRNRNANIFVNSACVSPTFGSSHLEMIYCDLMSIAPSISNLDSSDWVIGSRQFMNPLEEQVSICVPAQTLNQILNDLEAPENIDFLSIDVEGAETQVIEGLYLLRYRFRVVCVETRSVDEVKLLFGELGYDYLGYVNGNLILHNSKF